MKNHPANSEQLFSAISLGRKTWLWFLGLVVIFILTGFAPAFSQDLPAGVPHHIGPHGRDLPPLMFTTKAYQHEARKLMIREANAVANELQVHEDLPITESNLCGVFISTFGFAYEEKKIGTISTKNYTYFCSLDNKFNKIVVANYDNVCFECQKVLLPIAKTNFAGAYQLATQWLEAVSMDVKGLNRDCKVHVAVSPFWNGLGSLNR